MNFVCQENGIVSIHETQNMIWPEADADAGAEMHFKMLKLSEWITLSVSWLSAPLFLLASHQFRNFSFYIFVLFIFFNFFALKKEMRMKNEK